MDNHSTAVTVQSPHVPDVQHEQPPLTAREIKAQVHLVQEVMQAVMQEGFHYGVIPGTDKPTLLKPGAEKLAMTFRLAPKLMVEARDLPNGHREYQVYCTMVHIPTGRNFGEGVGSCSTMESKYRYRYSERTCPHCNKSTIIKGKAEYGGGWLCFQRKGGCGAKFADLDPTILSQATGKVDNPDIADQFNTALKMAKKRAMIDAVLSATAASDIFTQDLEETEEIPEAPPRQQAQAAPVTDRPLKTAPKPHDEPQAQRATTPDTRPITEAQQKRLFPLLKEADVPVEGFKAYLLDQYKLEHTKDITRSQYDAICKEITEGIVQQWCEQVPDDEPVEEEMKG